MLPNLLKTIRDNREPQQILVRNLENRIRELIINKQITTISGKKLSINADTICVHGDTPDSLMLCSKIRTLISQHEATSSVKSL